MTYEWDQNIQYVSIYIPIHNKDKIDVIFSQEYLKISINSVIYKEGDLIKPIITSESFWYKDGDKLVIELAKRERKDQESIWNKCFIDEEYQIRQFDVDIKEVSDEYLLNVKRKMQENFEKI